MFDSSRLRFVEDVRGSLCFHSSPLFLLSFFFIFSPFLMTCRIFSGYASEMFSEIVNNSCIQTCGAWLFYSFSLGYSESVMDGFQDSRLFSEIGPSLELKHLIESNGISSTEDSMGSIDGAEAPHRNPHPTSNK